MNGSEKYEVLQRIAGVKIVVFRGREAHGGRPILLHQLTEANDHTDVLKRAIQYLLKNPASAGGRILDLVELQGAPFLVTADNPECLALREWLDWELAGPKPAPSAPGPVTREPGEFTRLFQKAPSAAAAPQQAEPVKPTKPGEFTQLFEQHRPLPGAGPTVSPAAPEARAPAPAENQPGEFTRLFRSPLTPPSEIPAQPLPVVSPSQRPPGEFTRIFGASTPSGASSQPPVTAPPSTAPPAPSPPPSVPTAISLTESLESRQTRLSPPAVTPPPASAGPGEFTRVITPQSSRTPSTPPPPPSSSAPTATPAAMQIPTAPTLPSPPAVSLPSAPVALPQVPTVPTPQAQAGSFQTPPTYSSGASPRTSRAMFILFGVLLLAALMLVVFVILRR